MIHQGDCLNILSWLEPESVQCVVTSPPYWGLRDYGIEGQVWDGKDGCEHKWAMNSQEARTGTGGNWQQARNGTELATGRHQTRFKGDCRAANECETKVIKTGFCIHCNAWLGSLGLEPTPELYISHMVQVFREVRRVLRKDGTVWLNLGDSYATSPPGNRGKHATGELGDGNYKRRWDRQLGHNEDKTKIYHKPSDIGLKPKDLCMIPARVALALQADGWWLRSDIIWNKPNPMPESVTDRPTKAHEYMFLLSKSAKYYYDADAVKENFADERMGNPGGGGNYVKQCHQKFYSTNAQSGLAKGEWLKGQEQGGRNKRSVWTIATQPYPEAHFATFPPKLVEPCIKAGSAIGDTVLDPFNGSGTVLYVSKELNRKAIGIELNPKYCELSINRLRQEVFNWGTL